jgi:glycosyltransferase involved in cell wall biosynthesis
MPDLSVVIGFRDWGLDRLVLALRTHAESTRIDDIEVIVSDYGSRERGPIEEVAREADAVYVRTELDEGEPWSRSRALNAGIEHSSASVIMTTDSDLLFTPETHATVLESIENDPHSITLMQCRDLPETLQLGDGGFDWKEFERRSRLRPRWGMGGMVAFPRGIFESVGGLDSRMEVYGGEDIDFVQRMRWAGKRVVWIDEPEARIFHVWHPSSRSAAERDSTSRSALDQNRTILIEDRTIVRNLRSPRPRPVATVAIATHDRASYLEQSVTSVLANAIENIEVLIVDDGSTDNTVETVRAMDDTRVRLVQQEHAGVAAARNRAVAEARADYVVVHDDDDIMLPWRIEAHFERIFPGVHGTYGGWIDFDDESGELRPVPGKEFSSDSVLHAGSVLAHGTLMMDARIYRRFAYNEMLRAGSDYNLILRLAAAGVRLSHTGHFHILRRLHASNLTDTNYDHQKESARRTTNLFLRARNKPDTEAARKLAREATAVECVGGEDVQSLAEAYLPDSLVGRSAKVTISSREGQRIEGLRRALHSSKEQIQWREIENGTAESSITTFFVERLSWPALREIAGFGFDLTAAPVAGGGELEESLEPLDPKPRGVAEFDDLMAHVGPSIPATGAAAIWFGAVDADSAEWFSGEEDAQPHVVSTLTRQYLVRIDNKPTLEDAVDALLAEKAPVEIGRFALAIGEH